MSIKKGLKAKDLGYFKEVKDIPIKDIGIVGNIRMKVDDDELSILMHSIKQHGLLQAIGVSRAKAGKYTLLYGHRRFLACKKLGWDMIQASVVGEITKEKRIIINIVENCMRKDVTPYEVGRSVAELMKLGLTVSQISVRIDKAETAVKSALEIFKHIPAEYQKRIRYMGRHTRRDGNLPVDVVSKILDVRRRYNLTRTQLKEMLATSITDEIKGSQMNVVASLMAKGKNVEEAVKESKALNTIRIDVMLTNGQKEELVKRTNLSVSKSLVGIIYGEYEPIKRIEL